MYKSKLDLVFSALADPTRRGMLAQLAEGETSIGTLAERYEITQPSISKHIKVLEKAGLIQRTKRGREHLIRVDPRPIEQANSWIGHYARLWKQQFDDVEAYLRQQEVVAKNNNRTRE